MKTISLEVLFSVWNDLYDYTVCKKQRHDPLCIEQIIWSGHQQATNSGRIRGGGVLKGFFYTIIEIELRSFCLIQIKSGDVNGVAVRRSYPDIDGELHGTNLG